MRPGIESRIKNKEPHIPFVCALQPDGRPPGHRSDAFWAYAHLEPPAANHKSVPGTLPLAVPGSRSGSAAAAHSMLSAPAAAASEHAAPEHEGVDRAQQPHDTWETIMPPLQTPLASDSAAEQSFYLSWILQDLEPWRENGIDEVRSYPLLCLLWVTTYSPPSFTAASAGISIDCNYNCEVSSHLEVSASFTENLKSSFQSCKTRMQACPVAALAY